MNIFNNGRAHSFMNHLTNFFWKTDSKEEISLPASLNQSENQVPNSELLRRKKTKVHPHSDIFYELKAAVKNNSPEAVNAWITKYGKEYDIDPSSARSEIELIHTTALLFKAKVDPSEIETSSRVHNFAQALKNE